MDPIALFLERRAAAVAAGALFDGTKAVLSTATKDGVPSSRYVLVKEVGEDGFFVYTNYESRKGIEMAENPWASMVLYWPRYDRQVRVEGPVARLPPEESDAYFQGRPRESRIEAWASPQSQVVSSRAWLERYPNLIVTRTFSKIYGMAGLRVGYALSSAEVADLINRVRQPFNVNMVAMHCAEAALADDDFVVYSTETNAVQRASLAQELEAAPDVLAVEDEQGQVVTVIYLDAVQLPDVVGPGVHGGTRLGGGRWAESESTHEGWALVVVLHVLLARGDAGTGGVP